MPWRLEMIFQSESKPYFVFDPSVPRQIRYDPRSAIPPKEFWPIKIRQMSDHKVIPDYIIGPTASWLMVSKRFKDLVEAWDPVKHVFVPLEVEKLDGKLFGYINRLEPPLLYWCRSKIKGRHIWSDPMFKHAFVVSDEFYTWLKRNNISVYQAQQNLITEDEV